MIRVMIYLDSDNQQLAEIEIERVTEVAVGYHEYVGRVVVDTGENIRGVSKTFMHLRDTGNVLALVEDFLSALDIEQTLLDCPVNNIKKHSHSWPHYMEALKPLGRSSD